MLKSVVTRYQLVKILRGLKSCKTRTISQVFELVLLSLSLDTKNRMFDYRRSTLKYFAS
jgi:hypothetical protein